MLLLFYKKRVFIIPTKKRRKNKRGERMHILAGGHKNRNPLICAQKDEGVVKANGSKY
jgi:hypothetical protein